MKRIKRVRKSSKKPERKKQTKSYLTTKQRNLIKSYFTTGDQWEAYKKAGYKGNYTACKNQFENKKIKDAIKKAQEQTEGSNKPTGKFTPKIKNKIIECIGKGLSIDSSCRLAGISYMTFKRWRDMANKAKDEFKDNDPYVIFVDNVETAKDIHEERLLEAIEIAGTTVTYGTEETSVSGTDKFGVAIEQTTVKKKCFPRQWKALAWILERRRYDKYAPKYDNKFSTNTDNGLTEEKAEQLGKNIAEQMDKVDVIVPEKFKVITNDEAVNE